MSYLRPGEVARLFRVDEATVCRWAADGRLPSIRTPGGHHRFREADILAFTGGQPVLLDESAPSVGDAAIGTLMRPHEVARVFRVSARAVSRWADDGLLPSARTPGGHHRFREQDVYAFLRSASAGEIPAGPGNAAMHRLAERRHLELAVIRAGADVVRAWRRAPRTIPAATINLLALALGNLKSVDGEAGGQ